MTMVLLLLKYTGEINCPLWVAFIPLFIDIVLFFLFLILTLERYRKQIEKMKCGGNCKHLYHVNTGGCYDAKCDLTYCDCINCKDKWELQA